MRTRARRAPSGNVEGVIRVRSPLLLLLDGALVPRGPERVELQLRAGPPAEHRVRVLGGGRQLWVDPSLPAPGDEGPLAPEAAALRCGWTPRAPLELERLGPLTPQPGVEASARAAASAALAELGAPPADEPADRALRAGEPCTLAGEVEPLTPAQRAWLSEGLLLARDPASPRPADPAPGEGLRAQPPAPREARAAGPPACPREERQRLALEAAGLRARWHLGEGYQLLLAREGAREGLRAALAAAGLDELPLDLRAPAALELSQGATP